jgi:thiamine pyrophosphate-dependent acetolactate synthase large subunit-like protein
MEALHKAQGRIRFVHVRHEESAALIACAYAKFPSWDGWGLSRDLWTGRHPPLLNGVYDTKLDQQPVLAITACSSTA